ncbi:S-adenosyl-L-methionine-dependent methyltransferase [Mycena vulgaris]|nr:S-adenosyl-L-methionine-dependent methyltransferase [Mycena vulgaris]
MHPDEDGYLLTVCDRYSRMISAVIKSHQPASESEGEMHRLDETHAAFSKYLGANLCLAPMAGESPRRILELGCGSGAWAIQAAATFPYARVLAVDAAPLPDRILPANVDFELVDLSMDLGFELETFDIVHARMVMGHVVNGENALKQAAKLVKPGGLLLLEDIDVGALAITGGPAVRRFASKIIEIWRSRGADAEIGRRLEPAIASLGQFPHVDVHKIAVPLCKTRSSDGDAERDLGLAMRKSWTRIEIGKALVAEGVTENMAREQREELDQGGWDVRLDIYFCWARRSVD